MQCFHILFSDRKKILECDAAQGINLCFVFHYILYIEAFISNQTERTLKVIAETEIRNKLMTGLEPLHLQVVNESELHAGHRSSPGTGESHFRVTVVSEQFHGLSRLQRHRMINEILADELAGKVHALAVHAYAPGEFDIVDNA